MSPLAVVSVFLLTWSGGVISSDSICHKSLTLGNVYKFPFAYVLCSLLKYGYICIHARCLELELECRTIYVMHVGCMHAILYLHAICKWHPCVMHESGILSCKDGISLAAI